MSSPTAESLTRVQTADLTHKAARRRGRAVFKLGAALYLLGLSEREENVNANVLQTPGDLSEAMKHLWGHGFISHWYLSHHAGGEHVRRRWHDLGYPESILTDGPKTVGSPLARASSPLADVDTTPVVTPTTDDALIVAGAPGPNFPSRNAQSALEMAHVAMEGSWKEELGWRALEHPTSRVLIHNGLYAPLVLPNSTFVFTPDAPMRDEKKATKRPDNRTDTNASATQGTGHMASIGAIGHHPNVVVTWQKLDQLNARMGRGFLACWQDVSPFFDAEARQFLATKQLSAVAVAAPASPVPEDSLAGANSIITDTTSTNATADPTGLTDLVFDTEMISAESRRSNHKIHDEIDEEGNGGATASVSDESEVVREDYVRALAETFSRATRFLRSKAAAPAAPSSSSDAAAAPPPHAKQGWVRLDVLTRYLRKSLPPCFGGADGELPALVSESTVILVLLLRLDLQQQLQFTVTLASGTSCAGEDAQRQQQQQPPIFWVRAVWGHNVAGITDAVEASHPSATLRAASEEVTRQDHQYERNASPVSETTTPTATPTTPTPATVKAQDNAWQELVESIAAWGLELGSEDFARLCPPRRPFLALLSPSVCRRLRTVANLFQRVIVRHGCADTEENCIALLAALDEAVRAPLHVVFASSSTSSSSSTSAAARAALETVLQRMTAMEWAGAALKASKLVVFPYTSLDCDDSSTYGSDSISSGMERFTRQSAALVPLKASFIGRHGKTHVRRVAPFILPERTTNGSHTGWGGLDEAAAASPALDLWLLSVYSLHKDCCPNNASLITASELYNIRKMKVRTVLPLLRLPRPDWWTPIKAGREEQVSVQTITTHPLSCPVASLDGDSADDEEISETTLFVAPPSRVVEDTERANSSSLADSVPVTPPPQDATTTATAASPDALPTPPYFPTSHLDGCLARFQCLCIAAQRTALATWMVTPAATRYGLLGGATVVRGCSQTEATLSKPQLALWEGLAAWAAQCSTFHRRGPFASSKLALWLPPDELPAATTTASSSSSTTSLFKIGYRAAVQKVRRELTSGVQNPFAPVFMVGDRALSVQCVPARVDEDAASHPCTALLLGAHQVLSFNKTTTTTTPKTANAVITTAWPLTTDSVASLKNETPASAFFAPYHESTTSRSTTTTTTTTASTESDTDLAPYHYLACPAVYVASQDTPDPSPTTWPSAAFAESGVATAPTPTFSSTSSSSSPPSMATLLWGDLRLTVTWSAEQLVDALLCPPLFACVWQYAQERPTLSIAKLQQRMRSCLVQSLTDMATMERYEFVGDALVDYVLSIRVLTFTNHAGTPLWIDTEHMERRSTNSNLANSLPLAIRHFLASTHSITNEKRYADAVESLFGALAASLWALPVTRGVEPDASLLFRCASVLMEIFHV